MECQICNGTVTPIKTNDVEILACKKCQGFWVKRGDLNRLVKHAAGDLEFSSVDHHMHQDSHGIMKCAFCDDRAMIKSNFIGDSEVVLDHCEGCGAFWIDAGELEKMEKYVELIEKHSSTKNIVEIIMKIIYSLPKV